MNKIELLIFQSHEVGAVAIGMDSMPCSLCRKVLETHPDAELITADHFHGSNFAMCARKLYLQMIRGRESGLNRASFLTMGHYFEKEMLENIKAGLPPSNDYKIKILANTSEVIMDVLGFKLVTHRDAYLLDNKNNKVYILECKAIKNEYFIEMKKQQKSGMTYSEILRDEWIGQGQSYLFTDPDVSGLIYIIKNRETSEILFPILIERDMKFIASRLNKLAEIHQRINLGSGQPDREEDNPKSFQCSFCSYAKECWSL